jgi:hypothetical protein
MRHGSLTHAMLVNIGIGALLFLVTTGIHAGGMLLALRRFEGYEGRLSGYSNRQKTHLIGRVILLMFMVAVVEVGVWAGTYLLIGAIQEAESAFYFSTVTFTTLGYGDIVLSGQWRILSAFEAANGIIMFGWSTAVIYAAVQRIYFKRSPGKRQEV